MSNPHEGFFTKSNKFYVTNNIHKGYTRRAKACFLANKKPGYWFYYCCSPDFSIRLVFPWIF